MKKAAALFILITSFSYSQINLGTTILQNTVVASNLNAVGHDLRTGRLDLVYQIKREHQTDESNNLSDTTGFCHWRCSRGMLCVMQSNTLII
jgi:hypothetical protein